MQVHPTVALPFVSVRGLLELRGAHERAGNAAVAVAVSITREKLAVLAGCRVVVTAVIQRRVIEHVELVGLARQRREAYVDEYGRAGRICDVGLSDTVLPVYVRVDLLIGKRASAVQESHLVVSSLSLQLGERLAVADDELQVSHAGCPDVWVVDFGELTVVECVPDLAGGRVRGPEAVLVCLGADALQTCSPRSPMREAQEGVRRSWRRRAFGS